MSLDSSHQLERSNQSEPAQPIQRGHPDFDEPLNLLVEDRGLLSQRNTEVIGKPGFRWREELSENGQKLYELLLNDLGDKDFLPADASMNEFNLNATIDELRRHNLLDEGDPKIVKLVKKRL